MGQNQNMKIQAIMTLHLVILEEVEQKHQFYQVMQKNYMNMQYQTKKVNIGMQLIKMKLFIVMVIAIMGGFIGMEIHHKIEVF
ncbi:hypothetical protein [Snodgrassella sp. CS2]|uniref:hypothetical protein n=1 Tax=Snodgrassella sp. CS2 TaxID=3418953 RepID=UPI003D068682